MDNISLFEFSAVSPTQSPLAAKLDIVHMEFVHSESLSWQELFSGYDTLHAITYSSGIGFICDLIDLFQQAEIIFGCEEVLSYSLQEIMAYQSKLLDRIRETTSKRKLDLIGRIEEQSLCLYVAKTILSHEKLYLLSAKDGRRRVILGSANMSYSAFAGKQRENIFYMDGDEAYDWYLDSYCSLRESSTDQIVKEALLVADTGENLEELPVARTVRIQKAMILEPLEGQKEEVHFALDVKNLAQNLAPSIPKPDKKGKLLLSPDKIKSIRRHIVEDQTRKKKHRSEYPKLEIFLAEQQVRLNGELLHLTPKSEEIQNDVMLFLDYLEGYEKFHGNVVEMQQRYYEFANWFFCSPFMASMRDMAVRYNQNLLPYPVFGLIYGQSKAGKTSFLETLLKMMIGQKTKMSAPDFTRSSIESLKRTVCGAPIIVDDLTNKRFNDHAIETIKNDEFGVADQLFYYPAVVISANEDIRSVASEISRRAVICRIEAGLTNTEVMRSSVVRTVQRKVGTAFYREYLRRMLDIIPYLVEEMRDDGTEHAPDILAHSSQVLLDIFSEFSERELPDYIRLLTLDDYFSEKVTGKYAITMIAKAWEVRRDAFEIFEGTNELCYHAGDKWEVNSLAKELPETLEVRKTYDRIIMRLDTAREFFGIPFKKTWLPWKR